MRGGEAKLYGFSVNGDMRDTRLGERGGGKEGGGRGEGKDGREGG